MAEYSANTTQVVAPGNTVVFTDTPVPCKRGFVRHREGSGNFLLSGKTPNSCCCNKEANYLVEFGANIAVPEDGTVGEISLALALDGSVIPASEMVVTPSAVNTLFNVSRAINVQIWNGCCETITVVNTSSQDIQVANANIIITRPDLVVTR